MAVRAKGKITDALSRKGFTADDSGHHVFFFFLSRGGQKTSVFTYVSHGRRSEDIGDDLIGKMAKQCWLTKREFLDLVDCDLEEDEYRLMLAKGGHINA